MKKIAVVTSTRAEYGLLLPVIAELRKHESQNLRILLVVTGTHLSQDYGMTIDEIKSSGARIDFVVPVSVKSETEHDISLNQAETLVKFSDLFLKEKFSAVILLGDRYETLAEAIAAGNTGTPIFHLYGGDTTEGANDEWIRHAITKISYLHFASNEQSRQRIIQLGEAPERVFNYGSTSIDNVLKFSDIPKDKALQAIGLSPCNYALCTYHPVTAEHCGVDEMISDFIEALKAFPEITFVITKSNADHGGARINELLDSAAETTANVHVFASLGVQLYLSLMKHAEFVLGNSSSGIIETPALHIPTVNIGDRQRGRLQAGSIINSKADTKSIISAIHKAMTSEHKALCINSTSPYGFGNSAVKIAERIIDAVSENNIDLKKKFYNLAR